MTAKNNVTRLLDARSINYRVFELSAEKHSAEQTAAHLALLHRGFQIANDASAQSLAEIHVNGGRRGLTLRLAVADLLRLTDARVVNAAEMHPTGEAD